MPFFYCLKKALFIYSEYLKVLNFRKTKGMDMLWGFPSVLSNYTWAILACHVSENSMVQYKYITAG